MNKRLLYVYNPNAGKGLIVPKLHEVVDMFIKDGFRVEIYPTQGQKDAIQIVEKMASEYDIVACSGGDGTLDEVVTGMLRFVNSLLMAAAIACGFALPLILMGGGLI